MTALTAITAAAHRIAGAKRALFLMWISYLLLAAAAAAPVTAMLASDLARSRYTTGLLKEFDYAYLAECLARTHAVGMWAVAGVLGVVAVSAFLVHVLLAGGALQVLSRQGTFFEGCGRYFWRFVRLLIFIAILYGIVGGLNTGLGKLAQKIWGHGMEQKPLVVFGWFRQGLQILLLGFAITVSDYAKVHMVANQERGAWRNFWRALKFVLRELSTTMGAWAVISIFGLLLFAAWQGLDNLVTSRALGAVLALAVLQQLYVLSRAGLRMMYWGAALEIDGALRAPAPPPEAPVPVGALVEPPLAERSAGAEAEPQAEAEPGGEAI
jgi:hypothetical protein